ncbi:tetratricopeptide repeat protein [Streptomyces filamentosus]|uniref:tetratricopeptide repeat protein n=1 Tax=Streptomyces filamentosus TaxID=67294 RepID=UPI0037D1E36A
MTVEVSGAGAVGAGGDIQYAAIGPESQVWRVGNQNEGPVMGGLVQAGIVHIHQDAVPSARWPVLVGRIPTRADCFQQRPELDRLEAVFADTEGPVTGQVITGTAGVGKTQLAARYAQHLLEKAKAAAASPNSGAPAQDTGTPVVDLVVWVSAADPSDVTASYAQAARTVEPGRYDGTDADTAARGFLAWLQMTTKRWLVVLDDAPSSSVLTALWPPQTPQGRTVVTTRSRDAAWTTSTRTLLPVGVFTEEQSLLYLRGALGRPGREEQGHGDTDHELAALATDLGHLPIALAQAAAYLTDTGRAVERYRDLLAQRARRLDQALPGAHALPDQQQRTIAALWDISIEQADSYPPVGLARPLLEIASLLSPEQIPDTVFIGFITRFYLALCLERREEAQTGGASSASDTNAVASRSTGEAPLDGPVDEVDAEDALRVLHRLNLLDHTLATQSTTGYGLVRIHQLVQRAVREQCTAQHRLGDVAFTAGHALHQTWPAQDFRDRELAATLRANTTALIKNVGGTLLDPVLRAHPILFRAGRSFIEAGLYPSAMSYWSVIGKAAEQLFGADDPQTLDIGGHFATALREAGHTSEAVLWGEHLVSQTEQLLGHDTYEAYNARHGLALSYRKAKRTEEAVRLGEQVVTEAKQLLGDDHHQTLRASHNLAAAYLQAGNLQAGTALAREVLTATAGLLGNGHPDTIAVLATLASAYRKTGQADEAIKLGGVVISETEHRLGHDHPEALHSRYNHAAAHYEAGHTEEAIRLGEELLADRERIFGQVHPDTVTVANTLAAAYRRAGRLTDSLAFRKRVLARYEQTLGNDHERTIIARSELVTAYRDAGLIREAVPLQEQVLAEAEQHFGADHLNTLLSRSVLALLYFDVGNLQQPITTGHRVLEENERVLGADHVRTLGARAFLTAAYHQACMREVAIPIGEQAVAEYVRVLGPDDHRTVNSRKVLAQLYFEVGRHAEAIEQFQEALEAVLRACGPADLASAHARANLANALTSHGRTLLPTDRTNAWQKASAAVQTVGPHLENHPEVHGLALNRAYLLAADILDADGQPHAAAEYRTRAHGAAHAAASGREPTADGARTTFTGPSDTS